MQKIISLLEKVIISSSSEPSIRIEALEIRDSLKSQNFQLVFFKDQSYSLKDLKAFQHLGGIAFARALKDEYNLSFEDSKELANRVRF